MSDLVPTWVATLLASFLGILALIYVHRVNARRAAVSTYKAAFASGIAAISNNSFAIDTFSSAFLQHKAAVDAVRPFLPKRYQRKLQKAWDEYCGKDSGLGYDDQGYVAAASATIYTADKAVFDDFKKRFAALHKTVKLAALRNAILNIASGQAPDDTVQHLLLSFVDEFSEMHLRILKVFSAPEPPPGMSAGGLGNVLEHNIPELRGRRELYDQLWKDLYNRGLVNTGGLHMTISGRGLGQRCTTGLGEALLQLIAEGQA